jgi:SnoaL-like domain
MARCGCPTSPSSWPAREEIRAWGERVPALVDFLVQLRDGRSELNYAIYHDRYQRTSDGWKFTERVYEVRYLDHSPLAGSAPAHREPANPSAGDTSPG